MYLIPYTRVGDAGRTEKYVNCEKFGLGWTTRTKDRGWDVKNEYELLVTVVKDIKYAHFCVDYQ